MTETLEKSEDIAANTEPLSPKSDHGSVSSLELPREGEEEEIREIINFRSLRDSPDDDDDMNGLHQFPSMKDELASGASGPVPETENINKEPETLQKSAIRRFKTLLGIFRDKRVWITAAVLGTVAVSLALLAALY